MIPKATWLATASALMDELSSPSFACRLFLFFIEFLGVNFVRRMDFSTEFYRVQMPVSDQMRPRSRAMFAACVRFAACSLIKMLET